MEPDAPDAEIVRSIASQSGPAEEAEATLYRRFAPRIELYGLKHLGGHSAAEDLVHEVILRVLQAVRAGKLENPASLASFVLGTCRNVTWDLRRGRERQRKIERDALDLDAAVNPPSLSERDVTRLFKCMAGLKEREALVIRMSFFEDKLADEIGTRLDLSAGNVRIIRHRALAKLAECLNPEPAS
ncbi:MAG TPA: sigma-70 family RNA polymerase sigma factor [Polyangiaceae bacterium]